MDDQIRRMARESYGYGRWDAPYWFIGPEPGQGREERGELSTRAEAWCHLGEKELNDCRDFHEQIREKRWHRENPPLQATWRRLMLLLMAFLGRPTDNDSLRDYQRNEWGMTSGETCVIELSGLAAKNLKTVRDRELFREPRKNVIRRRMHDNNPTLVVMYGRSEKKDWNEIAGCALDPDGFRKIGPTIVAFTPHPVSRGLKDDYWKQIGETLRRQGEK